MVRHIYFREQSQFVSVNQFFRLSCTSYLHVTKSVCLQKYLIGKRNENFADCFHFSHTLINILSAYNLESVKVFWGFLWCHTRIGFKQKLEFCADNVFGAESFYGLYDLSSFGIENI